VDTILVVGIETVVGANFAAHFAEQHDVVGVSCGAPIRIEGCRTVSNTSSAADIVAQVRPAKVIYCGPESRSSWDPATDSTLQKSSDAAREWARASAAGKAAFAMISSDAVFTGPWIFHDEDSTSESASAAADSIRKTEACVAEANPAALLIRTNAFGWSPLANGWLEKTLQTIELRRTIDQDSFRHSTPILATDLADIVDRAFAEGLTGLHHVAGAERVSPHNFVQRLADQFDLPWLAVRREPTTLETAGEGANETSLQTKKIRKALCVAMPMLTEGLDRLSAQRFNGHRDLLIQPAAAGVAAA